MMAVGAHAFGVLEHPDGEGPMSQMLLALAVLSLAVYQPKTARPSEKQRAAATAAVEAAVSGFWAAWAEADVDRGMSFMGAEATAVTSRGQILRGHATIDAAWRPLFRDVASQQIAFEETYVTVFEGFVCVQQRGTFRVTDKAGATGPEIPFAFTTVWTEAQGEWKIVAAHRTPVTPARAE